MTLIFDTANKLGVSASDVFDLASAFQDTDSQKVFDPSQAFQIWERCQRIPDWVESFCLDVMTDRLLHILPEKSAGEACLFED